MKLRVLTALILGPAMLWVIGWAPKWLFVLVLIAVIERGLAEYFQIVKHAGFSAIPALGYFAAPALCLAQIIEWEYPPPAAVAGATACVLIVVLVFVVLLGLQRKVELRNYLSGTATTLFGVMYIGFMLSWLVPLRFSGFPDAQQITVLVFLVVAFSDIFAYLIGKLIGRTLLVPRISPGKTLEGSIAGFVGGLLVGVVYARYFWRTDSLKKAILWSALIAIAAQLGDLVESAMKRAGDMKDSGTLLPGHGGLLDRIDSLILAVPVMWITIVLGRSW